MKSYLTRTRRGERKRGRREHQHHTPGPERANPERAREKEKRRVDGHGTRPAEGGEGRKRLNQPDTAKTYKHLSTRRSQPTWGGKNAWDRGPMGISWWNHKKLKQDSVPNYLDVVRLFPAPGPWSSLAPIGIKQLSKSSELGAQHVSPHQKPKRPHLQEKDMPVAFICSCHVSCQKLKLQVQKLKFLTVRSGFTLKELLSTGVRKGPQEQRDSRKGWQTARPIVSLYLNELPS